MTHDYWQWATLFILSIIVIVQAKMISHLLDDSKAKWETMQRLITDKASTDTTRALWAALSKLAKKNSQRP